MLSTRIVEGEKIAIAPPCAAFGERVKADKTLTAEFVDLSRSVTGFLSSALTDVPLIRVDNVTEFVYGETASGSSWDLRDLPTLVPPFPATFVETTSPPNVVSKDIPAWGAVFSRTEGLESLNISTAVPEDEVRWAVETLFVADIKGVLKAYPVLLYLYLDSDGKLVLDHKKGFYYDSVLLMNDELASVVERDQDWAKLEDNIFNLLLPFFVSLAFLNCKNVTLEALPISRQQRRQAERRGDQLLDYRILNVEPMKRVLRTEGRVEEVGPKQALHICRGHFKTYNEDRPLFGKVAGTWFWESSIRGSLARGKVEKDYLVNPPRTDSH